LAWCGEARCMPLASPPPPRGSSPELAAAGSLTRAVPIHRISRVKIYKTRSRPTLPNDRTGDLDFEIILRQFQSTMPISVGIVLRCNRSGDTHCSVSHKASIERCCRKPRNGPPRRPDGNRVHTGWRRLHTCRRRGHDPVLLPSRHASLRSSEPLRPRAIGKFEKNPVLGDGDRTPLPFVEPFHDRCQSRREGGVFVEILEEVEWADHHGPRDAVKWVGWLTLTAVSHWDFLSGFSRLLLIPAYHELCCRTT